MSATGRGEAPGSRAIDQDRSAEIQGLQVLFCRPKLREALRTAKWRKIAYVIIDGTLIPIDRIAADRPFYSGKHERHGVNLQVIASPDGEIR